MERGDLFEQIIGDGDGSSWGEIVEAGSNVVTCQRSFVTEHAHDVDNETPVVGVLPYEIDGAFDGR